jgi:hypothetical protein
MKLRNIIFELDQYFQLNKYNLLKGPWIKIESPVLIVTKSLIFLCEEIEAKWLLNDNCGLLEASTYCFSSVETKFFSSSGFFKIEIENEVTRKVVKMTPSRRII